MKKIFHLSNCDTCQRIIKETGAVAAACTFQDIKTEQISADDLDAWAAKTGQLRSIIQPPRLKISVYGSA